MEDTILDNAGTAIFWIVLSIVLFIFAKRCLQTVPEGNVRLVQRLGKYNRMFRPGLNFMIPFIEGIKIAEIHTYERKLDIEQKKTPDAQNMGISQELSLVNLDTGDIKTTEQILDPPQIIVISKDNAEIYPDAIVYFRIVDPVRAVYEVNNLGLSIYKLVETTLRQQIGSMTTDEIMEGREKIGFEVRSALEEASSGWGTLITRVELEEINFPDEIQKALSDQRAAELKGRAAVVKAERDKEAVVLEAEAGKAAVILNAEGAFEKDRLEAEALYLAASREEEGKAKGVEAMARALEKNPDAVVAIKALEAQEKIAKSIGKSDNALIIPQETAGLFGAIKSVGKLLNTDFKKSENPDFVKPDEIRPDEIQ